MDLAAKLTAILFYRGEPEEKSALAALCDVSVGEVDIALTTIEERLQESGLVLVRHESSILLATAPQVSNIIEKVRKSELMKDLGKAGLETLAIVAYQGPVSRAEIDYIRGVNSSYILRNLLIRGLIERAKGDDRPRYVPTLDFLTHLGIDNIEKLPEYQAVRSEIIEWQKNETQSRQL